MLPVDDEHASRSSHSAAVLTVDGDGRHGGTLSAKACARGLSGSGVLRPSMHRPATFPSLPTWGFLSGVGTATS
jgi:hypothetical protein